MYLTLSKKFKILFILFLLSSHMLYSKELKKVTLQLSWFNQFQFAGYYMAKEKGFFEELGLDVTGAVLASEAFFPFRDSIDAAAEAGVKCVIEPGGSIRDDEIIEAANEYGMALYFSGIRHFLH